jgi:hypothetical protein
MWVMQNAMQRLQVANPTAMAGWVLLLLTQSAFAWAYVRLLVGAEVLRREGRREGRGNGGKAQRPGDQESPS